MTCPSDFMRNCDSFFDNIGFERDEIMPLIRQIQEHSDYVDSSGESYTTPALELMRKYIAEHWSTFDLSDPHACTPRKEALDWLKTESAKHSGISKGMLEAIDLIVRHPVAKNKMNVPKSKK